MISCNKVKHVLNILPGKSAQRNFPLIRYTFPQISKKLWDPAAEPNATLFQKVEQIVKLLQPFSPKEFWSDFTNEYMSKEGIP